MSGSPIALVTGASRGIGRAIAQQLATRGCRIALHFNTNRAAADEALQSLAGSGHALFSADLSSGENIARLWRQIGDTFGSIDIVVNNAGVYSEHPPLNTGYGEWQMAWQHTLATNLFGPANLCYLAAHAMSSRALPSANTSFFGRGRIVNISSRGAFRGEPDGPAYGASKAGLNSLSQSLAKALAPESIYVFCLAPGWVETEMAADHLASPGGAEILAQHPLGRVATPEEIARVAAFCALDAPAAMTGSIIDINGASYLRT